MRAIHLSLVTVSSLLAGGALMLVSARAQTTVATSPVGFISTSCPANTDTNLSISFTRPAVYVGAITSAASGSPNGTITFTSGAFTTSALKYMKGTQSNTYYAFVTSGAKEGSMYDIVDNTDSALTVNLNGDSISSLASGAQVRIIPHWTLGTAFTVGTDVIGSPTLNNAPTQVLVPDQATAGTDLLAAATYYYYTGASAGGPGWRGVGKGASVIFNDTVIYPETFFILRNNTANALTYTPVGSVSTLSTAVTANGVQTIGVNVSTVLNTLAANTDQDNSVALPVVVDTTLIGSNLYQSGAFTGSSNFTGTGDQVLVYDNSTTGTDKIAARTYYYYTGTAGGGAGWRQVGGGASNIKNTDVLKAGVGFVVRKRGASSTQSIVWNYRPTYTP